MQKVVQFPPPREGKQGGANDHTMRLSTLNPKQAAELTGISYTTMLALFKVHGIKIGRLHYMPAAKLERLLNGGN